MLAAEPESLPGGTGFDCMKAAGYRGVMKSSWDGHFERLLVKVQHQLQWKPRIEGITEMGCFGTMWQDWGPWRQPRRGCLFWRRYEGDGTIIEKSSGSGVEPAWVCETNHVSYEWWSPRDAVAEAGQCPEDCEWIPDTGHWAEDLIYNVGVLFCFGFIATMPWIFPSWNEKVCNVFLILMELTVIRLLIL